MNGSSVPQIVVQDEVSGATDKTISGQGEYDTTHNDTELPSQPKDADQVDSFGGLPAALSINTSSGFDLADLASDKVAFSPRGSILFGGKKMHKRKQSEKNRASPNTITSEPNSSQDGEAVRDKSAAEAELPEKKGLVAGRRKPSAQMLQAVLQGGRVLSAEETNLSLRVRSMYEYGDERAADWTTGETASALGMRSADSVATENSTPDASVNGLVVGKTREPKIGEQHNLRSPTPNRQASYSRDENELAGGIEDWNDVEGQDVDRYGFIDQKRISSRHSIGEQAPNQGMHRVATALRIESGKPRRNRKLRRASSSAARSARPFSPTMHRNGANGIVTDQSSQHSRPSVKRSGANPFRSRDQKVLKDAPDILKLPSTLTDSAGAEGLGQIAPAPRKRERKREDKWQSMAKVEFQSTQSAEKGGGMRFVFDANDAKVVSRTWKGIPDRWRGMAWHSFLSASAKKRGIGASDEELILLFHKLQDEGSADDVQIDLDVPRTITQHIMFRRRYRGGQRLLFHVLHAMSLYFPDIGYVQGMASLAATLLCYFDEEQAFVMMVRLWQLRGLEQLFESGFGGLMKALEEFERDWLKGGDVAKKLDQLGITSTAYGTRWYLTLFNMSIPFPAQLRVWDVFMLLGDASPKAENAFGGADFDVLHATSAALIDATRDIILDSDFETAMKVLTSFVPVQDEDLLMRVAQAEWKLRKKRSAKT